MDVKQAIILVTTKGDFTFEMTIPAGSTWGAAIDSAYEFLQQVSKMSQEHAEKHKPTEAEPEVVGE